ncbi:MAG: hypothetical protein ACI4OU_00955 [Candidatus Enterenecus sp.]
MENWLAGAALLAGCGAWYAYDHKDGDELILFWDGTAGLLYVLEDYL